MWSLLGWISAIASTIWCMMLKAAAMDVLSMSMCLYYDIMSASTQSESWQPLLTPWKLGSEFHHLQVGGLHISSIQTFHERLPRKKIWFLVFIRLDLLLSSPRRVHEFCLQQSMAFWWQPIKMPISHRLHRRAMSKAIDLPCTFSCHQCAFTQTVRHGCLFCLEKKHTKLKTQELKHLAPKEW